MKRRELDNQSAYEHTLDENLPNLEALVTESCHPSPYWRSKPPQSYKRGSIYNPESRWPDRSVAAQKRLGWLR